MLKDGALLYSKKGHGISLSESLINSGANIEKLKKVTIEFKEAPSQSLSSIWFWSFVSLVLFPLVTYGVWFLVFYLLALAGFRILKIEEIPRSKIVAYIFVMFVLTQLVNPAINHIFGDMLNTKLLIFINTLIAFGITFLLLKYYILLSGKKLWQLLLYLIFILVLSNLIIFLLSSLMAQRTEPWLLTG